MVRRIAFVAGVLLAGCKDEVGDGPAGVTLAAPSNLAGAPQSDGLAIALSWTDASAGETGFRIEVNGGPFGAPPYLDTVFMPANATTHAYPTEPNQTRFFRVFALTAAGQSEPSNVISVATPDVPFPPAHFTVLATGPVTIDLRWPHSGPPLPYTLQRSDDGGATWFTLFMVTISAGTAQFQDAGGLAPDQIYYYRLWATTSNGAGGMSFASTTTQITPASMDSISTPDDAGWRTSLAVSPSGLAHVSHYENSTGLLLLTRGTHATGYSTVALDGGIPGVASGYHGTSIALDGSGKVHVLAHEFYANSLRHATDLGGGFAAATIDGNGGRLPQIRWSPLDNLLHAVYRPPDSGGSQGLLWTTSPPGAAWGTPFVIPIATSPTSSHSLAINSQGVLHVLLVENIGKVWLSWREPGVSRFSLIAAEDSDHVSLAIDGAGVFHAAWQDKATGRLRYANNGGGTWRPETVHAHTTGNLGTFNSIAVNPATGAVHVAYYNSVQGDLWYARRSPAGVWTRNLLDSSGDVGRYASIAVDPSSPQERVYIAYYDATNGNLKIVSHLP